MTNSRWLATAIWSFTFGLVASALAFASITDAVEEDSTGFVVIILAFATTGWILLKRAPQNRIGWIYSMAGLLGAVAASARSLTGTALSQGWSGEYFAIWWQVAYFPWILTMVSLPILLFPDGKVPSSGWRWVQHVVNVTIVTALVANLLAPGPINDYDNLTNPFGVGFVGTVMESTIWPVISIALLFVSLLGPPAALVVRFRRSSGVERLQLKWLVFSATIAAAGLATTYALSDDPPVWLPVVTAVGLLGVLAIPITTGMAVVRYRLYEIDRLISRTVTFALLVGALAAVYLVAVALITTILPEGNTLAVAASTLVVAALFNPLRRRIQHGIERRFFRERYDARGVVDEFAAHLRSAVDTTELARGLQHLVGATVKPSHMAIWVKDD